MKIIFDFDGTIVDNRDRFYKTYKKILLENNKKIISKKRYLKLRKSGTKTREIIKETCSEDFVEYYYAKRPLIFESQKLLKADILLLKKSILNKLKQKKLGMHLISLRKNKDNLIQQLKNLNIYNYFNKIISGYQFGTYKTKIKLIKKHIPKINKETDFIIGDSKIDILAGKELNIKTIFVCTGIKEKYPLETIKPDYVLKNINDLLEMLDDEK